MAEEKGVQRSGGEAEGDQASLETQVTHYSLLRVSVSLCVSLPPGGVHAEADGKLTQPSRCSDQSNTSSIGRAVQENVRPDHTKTYPFNHREIYFQIVHAGLRLHAASYMTEWLTRESSVTRCMS